MGTCIRCGKSGAFVFVNDEGYCRKCKQQVELEKQQEYERKAAEYQAELKRKEEEAKRQAEEENAQAFALLQTLYDGVARQKDKKLPSGWKNPDKKYETIPKIREMISDCKSLIASANYICNNSGYCQRISHALNLEITYKTDFDREYRTGDIPKLGIHYLHTSPDMTSKDILQAFIKSQDGHIRYYEKCILTILQNESELQTIEALPLILPTPEASGYDGSFSLSSLLKIKPDIIGGRNRDFIDSDLYSDFVSVAVWTAADDIDSLIYEVCAMRFKHWKPFDKFDVKLKGIPRNNDDESEYSFDEIIKSLDSYIKDSSIVACNLVEQLKFLYTNGYDVLKYKSRNYYDIPRIAQTILQTYDQIRDEMDKHYSNDYYDDYIPDYDNAVENYTFDELCNFYEENLYGAKQSLESIAYLYGELFHDVVVHKCTGRKPTREIPGLTISLTY